MKFKNVIVAVLSLLTTQAIQAQQPEFEAETEERILYHLIGKENNYVMAWVAGEKAIQYMDSVNHPDWKRYASIARITSYACQLVGENREALKYAQKSRSAFEKNGASNDANYAEIVSSVARLYYFLGMEDSSILYYTIALPIYEQKKNESPYEYLNTSVWLAELYHNNGDYLNMRRFALMAFDFWDENSPKMEYKKYIVYSRMAKILHVSDFEKSNKVLRFLIREFENMKSDDIKKNIVSYSGLPNLYSELGDKEGGLISARNVWGNLRKLKQNINTNDYIASLVNCFIMFDEMRCLGDAAAVLNEMNETYNSIENDLKLDYTYLISSLYCIKANQSYYGDIGDYLQAGSYCVKNIELTGMITGDTSLTNALNYVDLAEFYAKMNDTSAAILSLYVALDFTKIALGDTTPQYGWICSRIALFLGELVLENNNMMVDSLIQESLRIINNNNAKTMTDDMTLKTLVNVSSYYFRKKNYQKTIFYLEKILHQYANYNYHRDFYWSSCHMLGACYAQLGELSKAEKYELVAFEQSRHYLKQQLLNSPKSLKPLIWNIYSTYYTHGIPNLANNINSPTFYGLSYNACLLSKNIILSTDRSLSQIIRESTNKSALKLFDTILTYQKWISDLSELPLEKRFVSIDSLERQMLVYEQQLNAISKEYGDFTRDMSIEWTNVQTGLNDCEAAIEFNSFTTDNDSTIIVAYVVCPNWIAPKQVVIAELAKEESLTKGNDYSNTLLTKTIWGKLSPVLDGVKTIYFSPAGELYNIAIESLPDYEDSTRLISDRYNLYRLSSTRELAKDKKKIPIKNGSIYGGLRYDAKIDTTLRGTDGNRSFTYFPWTADSTSIGTRGNLPTYLPNTLTEAQYIGDLMSRTSIKSHVYTGGKGDEASFKRLSGSNANLLHIATHGFYNESTQEVKQNRESVVGEDKSMTRSGLLFAGVNTTLNSQHSNANTYNDGILTAQEIAQLDLKNVDMAVLSACETGLGELKGDGVFGLQRGFKKAGVNSIIMSLWKVDDRATQMLMTQFYENWLIKKMPKQKALKEAQEYVRNFEIDELEWAVELRKQKKQRGGGGNFRTHAIGKSKTNKTSSGRTIKPFQDPKYWAAFILLDGLD